ncbi:MAG: branched-chain amino acid ABC transporter substrate-binding protein [Anaerolineae bacterium]|nr:branched-chain amino acid ABC transporter substrate-binding protein [Anaerolineae bacterium]
MKRINLARHTLKIYILLMAVFLLPACAGKGFDGAPPTLKIGLVAPFEGLHRPLGYEVLFAVKLALQERNASGGVNGYQVELVALNDFDEPAEAQTQARALIADPDVLGVVGHLSSATTLAAMPIYQEAKLALSVPWTIDATAMNIQKKGVVRVAADYADTSARLNTFSQEWGYNHRLNVAEVDLDSLPVELQALELTGEGVAAGETISALRRAGVSLPLLGQVDVGSPQPVQVANGAATGLIFVSPGPAPRDAPGTEAFMEAYQTLAGFSPGPRAVLAYDATNILLNAIEQAMFGSHQPTRSEVSALINQVQQQGLSGDIVFDQQGRRLNAPVWVYQIFEEEQQYPGELIAP